MRPAGRPGPVGGWVIAPEVIPRHELAVRTMDHRTGGRVIIGAGTSNPAGGPPARLDDLCEGMSCGHETRVPKIIV
jgi:hypothetical protein